MELILTPYRTNGRRSAIRKISGSRA